MNVSTRFTVALHILTLLASKPGEALTSDYIAGSVNTNPVFVRKLTGLLRKKGWLSSQPGNGGGWKLIANPDTVTLAHVRQAVHEASPFSMHKRSPNPACPIGKNIQGALGSLYDRAERAMEEDLSRTTIRSLLSSVQRKSRS